MNRKADIMRKFLILGAAALATSACSDKGADADGDGKITTAEVTAEMSDGTLMKMEPGEWETKIGFSDVQAKNLPPQALAAMKTQMAKGVTTKSCMTKEQSEKPGSDIFGAPPEANCSFEEFNKSGDTMKVSMTCKPAPNMVVKSEMNGTFSKTNYTLNIVQSTEGPPMGAIKLTGKTEGKRLGDCPA
jgi:Protein of unknown function (DUF3617)